MSTILGDLLADSVNVEGGAGLSRGGRRPIVSQINPDAGRVVGVDIGASHLMVVVADLRGDVLAEVEEPLRMEDGPELCLQRVFGLVEASLAMAGCSMSQVTEIWVRVPGPVIASVGIVSTPPIMPGWDSFPIRQQVEDHWHKPTTLDNDADLATIGEWAFGVGRGLLNLAYIKIGTGIGCGLLLDGHL